MTQPHQLINRRTFLAGALVIGASTLLGSAHAWADEDIDYNALKKQEEEEVARKEAAEEAKRLADEEAARLEEEEKRRLEEEQERLQREEEERAAKEAEEAAEEAIEEARSISEQIVALQDELDVAASNYYKALDEHDECVNSIEEAQTAIAHADEDIAEQQAILAERARTMYRDGQSSTWDLVLGATTFEEFALNWSLLSVLNEEDSKRIAQTKDLKAQVEALESQLQADELRAAAYMAEADSIRESTQSSIEELELLLADMDVEVEKLVEEAQSKRAKVNYESSRKMYSYTSRATRSIPSHGTVVDYALSRIGCPYVWGAEGPDEFDCSGLVRWAYLQIGMSLPHQTEALYHAAAARLEVSEARPGDVLWIGYGDGYNGHVGIAITNGGTRYVHAPTFGAYVRDTDPLSWAGFTHCLRFK